MGLALTFSPMSDHADKISYSHYNVILTFMRKPNVKASAPTEDASLSGRKKT